MFLYQNPRFAILPLLLFNWGTSRICPDLTWRRTLKSDIFEHINWMWMLELLDSQTDGLHCSTVSSLTPNINSRWRWLRPDLWIFRESECINRSTVLYGNVKYRRSSWIRHKTLDTVKEKTWAMWKTKTCIQNVQCASDRLSDSKFYRKVFHILLSRKIYI